MPSSRLLVLAAAVLPLTMLASRPAPSAQTKRPMALVDLLNVPRVLDPQMTRDGQRVAFVLRTTDWPSNSRIDQIWQINADGTGLKPMTAFKSGVMGGARWSPDGSTLAVVAMGNIHLLSPHGAEPRQLSRHVTAPSDIVWSPDSRSIYFLAGDPSANPERDRQRATDEMVFVDRTVRQGHLWKIDVADGTEHRITGGDYSILWFKLSTDGSRVIVQRSSAPVTSRRGILEVNLSEVWSIKSDGADQTRLTTNDVMEGDAELAPDGSQVFFVARANGRLEPYYNANIFLVSASGGPASPILADFKYEVLGARWSADSKSIWMVANMGIHSEIFQIDVASRKAKQITDGKHSIEQWSAVTDGASRADRHVFLIDEPTRFGDIWTLAPGETAPRRITGIYDYLDREFALPRQERVEWKGADGTTIEGLLFYPLDYKPGTRYPLVVQLHGGPEESDRFSFGPIVWRNYQQVFAARGYALLKPNYRGSSGYGSAFYREPVGGYFKNSHLDVLAGVDRVVSMGVADPERLVVMGWSAGGHLVNKLITFTNRFKAASSGAGVANWISLYGQSDTRADRELWFGGSPWQSSAVTQMYWDHSPLKYVASAKTPTLFVVGENDSRVPLSQSQEMFQALDALNVPTGLLVAGRAGHVWTRPRQQLQKMNTELEWFARHALGQTYSPERTPEANDSTVLPLAQ